MRIGRAADIAAGVILTLFVVGLLAAGAGRQLSNAGSAALASATTSPAASATSFVVASVQAAPVTVASAADCRAVSDAWLQAWCSDTISYDPKLQAETNGSLTDANPADVGGDNFPAFEERVQGALAWGTIHGDLSVCDLPAVVLYVDAGAHTQDGAAACRSSLISMLTRGWFSVSNPNTGESLFIGLKPTFVGVVPAMSQ